MRFKFDLNLGFQHFMRFYNKKKPLKELPYFVEVFQLFMRFYIKKIEHEIELFNPHRRI